MKKIIGVHQLTVGNNVVEIMDFFKATQYTTPPMRAITGIRFPDGTICKYGEWILQYEDDSYSVVKDYVLQSVFGDGVEAIEKDLIIAGLEEGAENWKFEYDSCRAILSAMIDVHSDKEAFAQTLSFAKQFLKKYQHQ